MSDTKIFSFPEGGTSSNSGLLGVLAPMLQQRGLDPNMVFAMMNSRNNDGFGGEGSWFIWIIFLFFLMGWGGNGYGFGNRGGLSQGGADLAGLINSDNGRELLMSAIQGNGTAISQLASTLNCDVNTIQTAIGNLSTQLSNVGNQVGLSSQQVINALQLGNCQLGNQLAQCCCTLQDSITRQGYENQIATANQTNALQNSINFVNSSVERGFSSSSFETAQQTCSLNQALNQSTASIRADIQQQTNLLNDRFCQLEMREMQNKIDALREQNSQLALAASQSAQTQAIVNQLQPVAKPAYIVSNPYCNCGNGYGYYPYNNGCGDTCGC